MKGPPLNELKSLLGKIATELALAEPGKDMGLLPANCLLGQIEESIETLPEPIRDAMRQARKWLDEIFINRFTGGFARQKNGCLAVGLRVASRSILPLNNRPLVPFRLMAKQNFTLGQVH